MYGGQSKNLLHNRESPIKLVYWRRPERKIIKVNFDGCYIRSPGKGGIGEIFRNHRGKCLLHVSLPVLVGSSLMVEYYACW